MPLSDNDADYPALMMANYLLGGGGNSRLWKRIRETRRPVVRRAQRHRLEPASKRNSPWQASAIFAPQNRAKVEAAFREEIARALKDGFSGQELGRRQERAAELPPPVARAGRRLAAALQRNLDLGPHLRVRANVSTPRSLR